MISAAGSFFLGAGASVYHGLSNLADALHSPTVISQLESTSGVGVMEQLPDSGGMMSQSELLVASAPVALGVLSVAGIIESYTALVAWSELQREAKAAGFSSTKVKAPGVTESAEGSVVDFFFVPSLLLGFACMIAGIHIGGARSSERSCLP